MLMRSLDNIVASHGRFSLILDTVSSNDPRDVKAGYYELMRPQFSALMDERVISSIIRDNLFVPITISLCTNTHMNTNILYSNTFFIAKILSELLCLVGWVLYQLDQGAY